MNWFKKHFKESWNTWEPIMDTVSDKGPSRENLRKPVFPESEETMTQANPFFGGETRENDHHKDLGSHSDNLSDDGKTRMSLPGEETLIDKTKERNGLKGDEFAADGDFRHYREEDGRNLSDVSRSIDKGEIGPHNMQDRSIYNRFKRKIKTPSFNTI